MGCSYFEVGLRIDRSKSWFVEGVGKSKKKIEVEEDDVVP